MRKVKRLHSPDARILRELFVQVFERVIDVETAVGHLQEQMELILKEKNNALDMETRIRERQNGLEKSLSPNSSSASSGSGR